MSRDLTNARRRGSSGRVVAAESALKVLLLHQNMGDLAALAEMGATKELIANAFHCPIAFFTTQTNLANLQASKSQHMDQAVSPRLERRDEKLNAQLIPLYDPTGRLFLASEDPVPVDQNLTVQQQQTDMKYGVVTINELFDSAANPADKRVDAKPRKGRLPGVSYYLWPYRDLR